MSPVVRFAPSPTGRLHIGNVRTALINWLFARKHAGQFILRLDDTDRERSTEAHAEAIRSDLAWLGLDWDHSFRQSDRTARYDDVAAGLKQSGRLYPCYETEDELDRKRKRQAARGLPPIYDRAALRLTADERAKLEASGIRPHWRFRLANTEPHAPDKIVPTLVRWADLVRGDQIVDVGSLSDPVLQRGDGTYLYTFTSVVDDIDTKITHVVRGEDHVTNTGVQIQIFEALGAPVPAFAHFSLLVDKDGSALSKRLGSLSVEGLREAGLEAMAVVSHSALIGTSDAVQPHADMTGLIAGFDFAKLSRTPSRFDVAELEAINARLLHALPYAAVETRLAARGIHGGAAFWDAVRGNLGKLEDTRDWWRVVAGPIAGRMENAPFLAAAASLLPPAPFNADTWTEWTNAVKSATGAKGRALFHPLRLALTGRETGPEMKALLPLIGRERALKRLAGETA
jgi:glutamyl-tRNA synthetase